ncbi:MAG: prepilin-type N-terminal cleavage/methylation domain-containing protein [Deltaproteobacteria bacterium]|nr:MAG: prepilin-type N-terminal cleavage/methylation domain-containing protein [Deltaproteobacteria bacterium]
MKERIRDILARLGRTRRGRLSQRGMTIIEMMIVLVIMGMIMVTIGGYSFNAIQNARLQDARVQVGQLGTALEEYRVLVGEYPQSLDDLVRPPGGLAPIRREVGSDPWGNDFQYRRTSRDAFELFSAGPDGRPGTEDDIHLEGSGRN